MKIIRFYILKELSGPLMLSFLVFTFVMFMANLIRIADMVVSRGVALSDVGKLILFLIPSLLCYTIPMSVLTCVLLTFGRLSSDNEITAFRASGIALHRVFYPAIGLGIMASLFSILLYNEIVPRAHYATRKIVVELGSKNPSAYFEPGTYLRFGSYILFTYKLDPKNNRMYDVRIFELQPDKPTRTIVAEKAEILPVSERKTVGLRLLNGTSDEPDLKESDKFYKVNFKEYNLSLELPDSEQKNQIDKMTKDMTLKELNDKIKELKRRNIEVRPLVFGLHMRFSLSFASLALVLVGIPLGIRSHRSEKTIGFGISLGTIVVYYIMMVAGEGLVLKNYLPPVSGAWMSTTITIVCGLVLMWRLNRR